MQLTPGWAMLAAMASALLFSGKGVLMKLAFAEGASLWLFMALRMAYSLPLFLLLWVRAVKQARRQGHPEFTVRDWLWAAALGLLGYYLAGLLDMAGLRHVSAGLERLILYTHPSLVVIFGALFFGHGLSKPLIYALALGYGGLLLAFGEEIGLSPDKKAAWFGGWMIFGSAVAYAFFLLLSRRPLERLGAERFFTAGMLICTAAVLIQAFFTVSPGEWKASWKVHEYAILVAVFGTVLPTLLLGLALKGLGAERTSILGMVGPLFTLFFGYWALQEPLTWKNVGGLALTLAGGWVLMLEKRKRGKPEKT